MDFYSKIQQEYNKELELAWRSGVKKIGWRWNFKGKNKITVDINDLELENDAEIVLKELKNFKIDIYNNETIKQRQNIVNIKFEKDLKEGKVSGNFGGPGVDGFFDISNFLLAILFNWSISHFFEDVDDKAWNLFKSTVIKFYKLLAKSNKQKKELVIRTTFKVVEHNLPTIVFIFPYGMAENDLSIELDRIFNINQEVTGIKDSSFSVYEYTYRIDSKSWELIKRPKSNI